MPGFSDELKEGLDTVNGRRIFYDMLKKHEEELKNYYCINLPDYEEYESECVSKIEKSERIKNIVQKRESLLKKYPNVDPKNGERVFFYFLRIDDQPDAEEYNNNFVDMAKNDKARYADFLLKKLLEIDAKSLVKGLEGKTSDELAQIYINNSEPYDLGYIVKDALNIIKEYGKDINPDDIKKVEDKTTDLQLLVKAQESAHNISAELYAFVPKVKIDAALENFDAIEFGELDDLIKNKSKYENLNSNINDYMNKAFIEALGSYVEYSENVDKKVNDLLAACNYSEEHSWSNSKQYDNMKEALINFQADWKDPKKYEQLKGKLVSTAQAYLDYKANKTMKENAQGKVAAADGILELIGEIDKYKRDYVTKVEDFEKLTNDKSYEERAIAVHNRIKSENAKTDFNALNEEEFGEKNAARIQKADKPNEKSNDIVINID